MFKIYHCQDSKPISFYLVEIIYTCRITSSDNQQALIAKSTVICKNFVIYAIHTILME